VPLAYDVHPDFGYFCPGPRVRRELRVALVSMLFGMAIGAAIVTIRAGQASETDGVSSTGRLKSSGTDTWAPGVTGPSLQFKNADDAKAEPVEAIKPFPVRRVRMRPSKAASPIAGIPLGHAGPPEPDSVPDSAGQASPENAEGPERSAVSPQAQSFAATAESAVSETRKRLE
jgi:hypothetical protein